MAAVSELKSLYEQAYARVSAFAPGAPPYEALMTLSDRELQELADSAAYAGELRLSALIQCLVPGDAS